MNTVRRLAYAFFVVAALCASICVANGKLEDGKYTIQYWGKNPCKGKYLAYDRWSDKYPLAPVKLQSAKASKPLTWIVKSKDSKTITLEAASRNSCCPSKLSYFGSTNGASSCESRNVFLRKKGEQKPFSWEIKTVSESNGVYAMFAKGRLSCSESNAKVRLGPRSAESKRCSSSSLRLFPAKSSGLHWKFVRVDNNKPVIPTRPSPPPPKKSPSPEPPVPNPSPPVVPSPPPPPPPRPVASSPPPPPSLPPASPPPPLRPVRPDGERAGKPTELTTRLIISTGIGLTWKNGSAGSPVETYTIICTNDVSATSCVRPSGNVVQRLNLPTSEYGTLEGLTPNTRYKCWVKAVNIAGETCSDSVVLYTTAELTTGKVVTGFNEIYITPNAYTIPDQAQNAKYQVQCLNSSAVTCDPLASGTDALVPSKAPTSPELITNPFVTNGNTYQCFSVVTYTVNSYEGYACSPAFEVKPFTEPTLSSTKVLASDQTLTISPNTYTPPSGTTNVLYRVQCLSSSATICDPLATSTGAMVPTAGQSNVSAITISGLTNNLEYKCFSVVSYDLGSGKRYTCSESYSSATTQVSPVLTNPFVLGNNQVFITPTAYTLPTPASDVKYQVQCLSASETECDLQAASPGTLQPTTAQATLDAITVSGLTNTVEYKCFSVVSYKVGADTTYTCSGGISAVPDPIPTLVTGQVVAATQKITIKTASFSFPGPATNNTYLAQCSSTPISLCNPSAQSSAGFSAPGSIELSSLTDGTEYSCFSMVSFIRNSRTYFSCSSEFKAIPFGQPVLTEANVRDEDKQVSIFHQTSYTPPSGASNIQYQAQCLNSTATVCDPLGTGSGALTAATTNYTAIVVSGLTNWQPYKCFYVVSYNVTSGLKYTCSPGVDSTPFPPAGRWTTQTSPSGNMQWYSLIWAGTTGNQKFVAVANTPGPESVMTSVDGVNWSTHVPATNSSWRSIAWGGLTGSELFVAVGVGNRVMTSPDGVSWTAQSAANVTNDWASVTWGGSANNGTFVAVAVTGNSNRVMTSPNGVTWTLQTTPADNEWRSVTWGGQAGSELFVAVASTGNSNRVMTSPNAVNWTTTTAAAENQWSSVTWDGPPSDKKFVAVSSTGAGNRVMTSTDGINWDSRASAADIEWRSVIWGGLTGQKTFVAVGNGQGSGLVMTSPDGITWTSRNASADNTWRSVAWGGTYTKEKFVAVASSGTGNRVMTSP